MDKDTFVQFLHLQKSTIPMDDLVTIKDQEHQVNNQPLLTTYERESRNTGKDLLQNAIRNQEHKSESVPLGKLHDELDSVDTTNELLQEIKIDDRVTQVNHADKFAAFEVRLG